jgi:hypothetical protein
VAYQLVTIFISSKYVCFITSYCFRLYCHLAFTPLTVETTSYMRSELFQVFNSLALQTDRQTAITGCVEPEWRIQYRDYCTAWAIKGTWSILGRRMSLFLSPKTSIQLLVLQWVTGALPPGQCGLIMKLITHSHLVPRLRMCDAM